MRATYPKSKDSNFIVKKTCLNEERTRCVLEAYHRDYNKDPGKGADKVVSVLNHSRRNLINKGWITFRRDGDSSTPWIHSGGYASVTMIKIN